MTRPYFLFAYFTGNGEAGMRLASSVDGLSWTDLPGLDYLIRPNKGLMRDPFLYRGPDQKFHLIWTTNWESQEIGYASSDDLLTWSSQRELPVMASVPGTRNCWAPEMIYDEEKKQFVIFWASTVSGKFDSENSRSEEGYNHRMWYVTTSDFTSFSPPEILFDPGFNVIDATFIRSPSGKLKFVVKNENLEPVAKNLFFCEAASPLGPFSKPSEPFTDSWVEGPACLNLGDYTYVYFDQYLEKRYGAVRTRDFQNWENVSKQVTFPQGARHGSILQIPDPESLPQISNLVSS